MAALAIDHGALGPTMVDAKGSRGRAEAHHGRPRAAHRLRPWPTMAGLGRPWLALGLTTGKTEVDQRGSLGLPRSPTGDSLACRGSPQLGHSNARGRPRATMLACRGALG